MNALLFVLAISAVSAGPLDVGLDIDLGAVDNFLRDGTIPSMISKRSFEGRSYPGTHSLGAGLAQDPDAVSFAEAQQFIRKADSAEWSIFRTALFENGFEECHVRDMCLALLPIPLFDMSC